MCAVVLDYVMSVMFCFCYAMLSLCVVLCGLLVRCGVWCCCGVWFELVRFVLLRLLCCSGVMCYVMLCYVIVCVGAAFVWCVVL